MSNMMSHHADQFFHSLAEMSEFFCDELSEVRQRCYWQIMRERATLPEWQYACTQAMARETFHKVPLPAQLMEYVREYRRGARELRQRAEMLDGSHTTEQLLALRESSDLSAEVRKLIQSVWPEEH